MTKYEMWKAACERFEQWAHAYADKNVTDKQFFDELCCSVYSGDEFKDTEHPILDEDLCFHYKGYMFELTPCVKLVNTQEAIDEFVRGDNDSSIFTNRVVCWVFGRKDFVIHLVPNVYGFGANASCVPGIPIAPFILDNIDTFLEQNPDL